MANPGIPTIDLSPFFVEGDEETKKKAINMIAHACAEYGFFQIVNHGVPTQLLHRALDLSKTFFGYPDEEKLKSSPQHGAPLPAGYRQAEISADKNEFLMMFPPGSPFNVYPSSPIGYRETLDEVFLYLVKTASIIESIINDWLGLPPNFLKEYNSDRNWDLMIPYRYFPATETENRGVRPHNDANCITFVFQDEVGGLEVEKNAEWIPVTPMADALVVNVGDVIQVLSNERFKSATHQVVRQPGRHRHSLAFFYNMSGDKWVEPLPQFTKEIKEAPKYRGFFYKEYLQLRMRNRTHPPTNPADLITIKHYAITS